jgi:hypothetical protein
MYDFTSGGRADVSAAWAAPEIANNTTRVFMRANDWAKDQPMCTPIKGPAGAENLA